MGCVGCVFRMGFHTMGWRRPLLRFMLGVLFLIWMASAALLCQNPTSFLHTVAPSQLMQWLVFCTWTAMPFFGSPLHTACRCSLNLTFSVLFVSPTYTSSHSLQGISYTTPVCFSLGILDFTFIRSCLKVLIGLKTGFTPSGAQTFSIFSLRPLMYGVHSTFGASSSCCVLGGSERGGGWAERVFFVRAFGKPFAWKTWVRWSVSSFLFEGWQMLCALSLMHLKTPVTVLG